jgi:hypothetical protein
MRKLEGKPSGWRQEETSCSGNCAGKQKVLQDLKGPVSSFLIPYSSSSVATTYHYHQHCHRKG